MANGAHHRAGSKKRRGRANAGDGKKQVAANAKQEKATAIERAQDTAVPQGKAPRRCTGERAQQRARLDAEQGKKHEEEEDGGQQRQQGFRHVWQEETRHGAKQHRQRCVGGKVFHINFA